MFKALIVDDEETICNSIAASIDWAAFGIKLLGTCPDGVEAYHTILDECPDIVLTDIRMPGISGLDLVERISRTDLPVHFIILSGYGEFEYAKRAMKCGVKHYLLKPCDTAQIEACLTDILAECQHDISLNANFSNQKAYRLWHTLLQNMISDGCSLPELTPDFFHRFEQYINLYDTPYQLCYLFFLEPGNRDLAATIIHRFFRNAAPNLAVEKIYAANTLILYFPDFSSDYGQIDSFLGTLSIPGQTVELEYQRVSFADLQSLLSTLIGKLRRYDEYFYYCDNMWKTNYNYMNLSSTCNHIISLLPQASCTEKSDLLSQYREQLCSITNTQFLLQIADTSLIQLSSVLPGCSMDEIFGFMAALHQSSQPYEIVDSVLTKLTDLLDTPVQGNEEHSAFIEKTILYLHQHLSDPNITLKWISENHLYMNVNYVSRCFYKETGQKFSSYLMSLRMERAKIMFNDNPSISVQEVAEQVGCGNNPYYFNRIFKKCTGLSPSMYLKKIQN